jgi:hypothetical protein
VRRYGAYQITAGEMSHPVWGDVEVAEFLRLVYRGSLHRGLRGDLAFCGKHLHWAVSTDARYPAIRTRVPGARAISCEPPTEVDWQHLTPPPWPSSSTVCSPPTHHPLSRPTKLQHGPASAAEALEPKIPTWIPDAEGIKPNKDRSHRCDRVKGRGTQTLASVRGARQ